MTDKQFRYSVEFAYRTKDDPTRLQRATLQSDIGAFTLEQRVKILRSHLKDETLEFNSILETAELNLGDGKPNLRTNKRDKVVHLASDRHSVGLLCNSSNATGYKSIKTWVPEKVTCRKCIDVMEADKKRKDEK